jgi:hypothetical protein
VLAASHASVTLGGCHRGVDPGCDLCRAPKQQVADSDPLRDKDVVFSDEPIVTHPALFRWVLQASQTAIAPAEK